MEMLGKPCGQISRPQHRPPRHGKLCAPRGATVRIVRRNRRLGKRPWLTRGGRVYARSVILTARALPRTCHRLRHSELTIAVVPGVASAHASLKDSTPADESTATSEIDVIELEFTDDVKDPRVEVLDAAGQNHADGEVVLDGAMVQQAVGELESGEYVVAYQVISADGDSVSGTITLHIGSPRTHAATPRDHRGSRAHSLPLPNTSCDDRDSIWDGRRGRRRRDRGRVQFWLGPPRGGAGGRSPCRRGRGVLRREPNP